MKVKFNIAKQFMEPFIQINAAEKNDDLQQLADSIKKLTQEWLITGYQDRQQFVISLPQIVRFYTENGVVLCETTEQKHYRIKERIYFLHNHLPKKMFLQVSSAEIVNINQIDYFSLSKAGRYQINLTNGALTYASRRFVKIIKEELS
ncbi:LytTR family DNA-binding domain-containing protein [Fructilactobacillus frigidiflavus]|uniref:LytTR family DNA-binding domain-containing protein n=1 Tax=Fructilactobacillus frigidiflavus TaxID=3242688 RepID=UPI0037574622